MRVLLVALLLAGCGATSTDLSSSRASVLQDDVAAMSAAARNGDGAGVAAAYARLRRDVAAGKADGSISPTRAAQVLTAAAAVAADVPAPVPVVTPSPTPSPTARPVVRQPAPEPKKHRGKHRDKHDD